MQQVSPHLKTFMTTLGNLWLIEDSLGMKFLIDTGHAIERLSLLAQFWEGGIRLPGDLTAILLTHRHADHAGNAAFFRKRYGAKAVAHEDDASALSGRVTPPKALKSKKEASETGKQWFFERWIASYEDLAPAFCEIDETITQGYWKWGFHIIHVPGHTEGSILIFHEPTGALFTGDAITVTQFPWQNTQKIELADPTFSNDAKSCHLAVHRYLRQLASGLMPEVKVLCPGHGPYLDTQVQTRLLRLLNSTPET